MRQLLEILSRAYDRRSWHGTTLRGSLRGVSAKTAARRPARGRHNIWEVALHAAYWKYAVWRRLTGATRGTFPLKGSNWFERPDTRGVSEGAWREDVALLDAMHRQLMEQVAGLRDRDLSRIARGSGLTTFEVVAGIAAPDLYHAGQIQLLKAIGR